MTKDHNTEQAVKVRHAFENIRNNYVGWQDNPNFKVLEDALAALSQVRGKQEPVAAPQSDAQQSEKDAERYRVLRDAKYQLHEDDISVADSYFNVFFEDALDKAVDALKDRYDALAKEQGR